MGQTVKDIIDSMSEEQQAAVYALLDAATDDDIQHSDIETYNESVKNIIADGMKIGSLKDSFMAHSAEYGIDGIDMLFPDAVDVTGEPIVINRNMVWVDKVLSGTTKQPFSRIKSTYADLSDDTLRAKGYGTKGKMKKEDVMTIVKRTTSPTTIYKKQKLDRDDIIDITDFDVVSWIKRDLKIKLDEEIARCILIGDGRDTFDADYIDRESIRPILEDSEVYTIRVSVPNDADLLKGFIRSTIKSRKEYRGSGDPTLYIGEDLLADLLLMEDKDGKFMYESAQSLAKVLRVSEIVTVPIFEGVKRTDSKNVKHDLLGIIVNIRDYSVGTNKGGKLSLFDDFDIDYNQEKYLLETRMSGALTTPYSAIVIETPTKVVTEPSPVVTTGDPEVQNG